MAIFCEVYGVCAQLFVLNKQDKQMKNIEIYFFIYLNKITEPVLETCSSLNVI
jgi:hypothetical protein